MVQKRQTASDYNPDDVIVVSTHVLRSFRYWDVFLISAFIIIVAAIYNYPTFLENFYINELKAELENTCATRTINSASDESVVCVCNSSYCDDFPGIITIRPKMAVVITSSRDGQRFNRTEVKFGERNSKRATITLDTRKPMQEIIGFGGAFTDAAGINIAALTETVQDKLMDSYFSSKGLEYTVGRVPIASCDFSTREYSYDDVKDDFDLKNFALAEEDFKYKIPYIKKATKLSGNSMILFASPWSGPGWIKTSGRMKGGAPMKDDKKYHKTYANYYIKFFEDYLKKGIEFWGFTVQNEPDTGSDPNWPWQTMFFTAETESNFVRDYLGPTMKSHNITKDLKLMVLDHNRNYLPKWADTVMNDNETSKFVDGIGVHWYGDHLAPASVLNNTHTNHPNKFMLATEACTGWRPEDRGVYHGNWTRAEMYAESIIEDLNNFVAGWTDWNLCLDEIGGPNWVENFVDAPIIVNKTGNEFYKQPMFYALGHFSKFMRPKGRVVETTAPRYLKKVKATGMVNTDGRRVVTIMSKIDNEIEIQIEENRNSKNALIVKLPPRSITTLIWDKH